MLNKNLRTGFVPEITKDSAIKKLIYLWFSHPICGQGKIPHSQLKEVNTGGTLRRTLKLYS